MTLTIATLITNYNTWPLTTRCLQALNQWSRDQITRIVVVDDASTDARPTELSDNTLIVQNTENKGYVASVNIGFANIREDIVILLDSDAYPLMDIIDPLIYKFSKNPNIGAVGFELVDERGEPTGAESFEPTMLSLLLGQRFEAQYQRFFKLVKTQHSCIHSCAIAIRKIAFEEVGGFDEKFDFTDADIDFSMRLRNAGWEIQVDPKLILFHTGGGSFQTTSTRVLRHHKNRWRLLKKHGLIYKPWLLKSGLTIRHLIEYGILRVIGKQLISEPITLEDKLDSRKKLIHYVWNAYESEPKQD